MKSLTAIILSTLVLLLACGENKNAKVDKSIPFDLASTIMPDSALLQIDTVHLYTLRDSNFALYQHAKQQGRYEEAVQYNTLYRRYNDSIRKVQFNRELAVIRAKYDHEVLIGQQIQLQIEKTRIQNRWLLILIVCLSIGGIIALLYQHRTIRKVRTIRYAKKRLQQLADQIALNLLTIRSNENLIQTIREQLEQQTGFEEYLHEQQADLDRIDQANEQLHHHNEQLENEAKKIITSLPETAIDQSDVDQLLEENRILEKKEKYLLELLLQQLQLIGSLKQEPRLITPEEAQQLTNEMESIYPGFVPSLHETFPTLSHLDLLTCCLIKLKFTIPQIALITGVDAPSVSKRKLRIKEDMREVIPTIWDSGESLDVYLYKLTFRRKKRQ